MLRYDPRMQMPADRPHVARLRWRLRAPRHGDEPDIFPSSSSKLRKSRAFLRRRIEIRGTRGSEDHAVSRADHGSEPVNVRRVAALVLALVAERDLHLGEIQELWFAPADVAPRSATRSALRVRLSARIDPARPTTVSVPAGACFSLAMTLPSLSSIRRSKSGSPEAIADRGTTSSAPPPRPRQPCRFRVGAVGENSHPRRLRAANPFDRVESGDVQVHDQQRRSGREGGSQGRFGSYENCLDAERRQRLPQPRTEHQVGA